MRVALSVPADNLRGPLFMDQALAAIHQANVSRSPILLEISEHESEVTLICAFAAKLLTTVESHLYAAFPQAKISRIKEATDETSKANCTWSVELGLYPDLFPIKRYQQFEENMTRTLADPLTAMLQALDRHRHDHVSATIQISIRPARNALHRRAERTLRTLAHPRFQRSHRLGDLYLLFSLSHRWSVRFLGSILANIFTRTGVHTNNDPFTLTKNPKHDREADLLAAADKLSRQLFETHFRILVKAPKAKADAAITKIHAIAGAFGQFSQPRLGSFRLGRIRCLTRSPVRFRRPPLLMSTEELATLWHLPTPAVHGVSTLRVENREFTIPTSIPLASSHSDVAVLGVTSFRGMADRFGILPDDRMRHILVEGKTGVGKTTLLHQLLQADIRTGKGVCLIDPHGDFADAVIAGIPTHRTNDAVVFDVSDFEYPVAFNVLDNRTSVGRALVASSVLSAFKKLFGNSWGPRLEHIFRNSLLSLLEVPGTTLISVLQLLGDAAYRKEILRHTSDPVIRSFWDDEFAHWPAKFQAEAIAPIQNKVGHFVSSPILRNILGQAKSTVNLRQIMDEGIILVVNLSKGKIGDDASMLLGSLLVTNLQLAAMSRADLLQKNRRSFHVFVDEFQNFATDSFATILSESRKYGMSLTLANQYLAQMDENILAAVLGNIGTLIAFQIGAQDASLLTEQLGSDIQEQDLLRLPKYHAYVRLLIEGQPSRPFLMKTLAQEFREEVDRTDIVRRYSRQRYGQRLDVVNRKIVGHRDEPY